MLPRGTSSMQLFASPSCSIPNLRTEGGDTGEQTRRRTEATDRGPVLTVTQRDGNKVPDLRRIL